MEIIGIFYGTTSGNSGAIVEELEFCLKKEPYEVFNVKDGIESMSQFTNLILISPTYGVNELQEDWEKEFENLKKIDFSNKFVGIIGLGNQLAFGESYAGAMKILYDAVIASNGKIIGLTSTDGYKFKESHSVIDNKFVGLALDEYNDDDLTPDRIFEWVTDIKKEFK